MRYRGGKVLCTLLLVGALGLGLAASFGPQCSALGATPTTDPVNLTKFIGPDFCAAVVIHPSRLMKTTLIQALPVKDAAGMAKGNPEAEKAVEFFKPEKIRRVVLLIDPTPEGATPVSAAFIVQFEEPVDSQQFLKDTFPDLQTGEAGGVSYSTTVKGGEGGTPMAAYVAGPHTLLVALEPMMKKMLAPAAGPKPLLDQLRHSSLNNDILIEFSAEVAMKSPALAAALAAQKPDPANPVAGLKDDVKSVSFALNFTQEPMIKLTLVGAKKDSADKFNGLFAMGKMVAGAALANAEKNPPENLPPPIAEPLMKVAKQALEGLQVAKEGDAVVATLKTPESLPELTKAIAELLPMLTAGGMPPGLMPGGAPGAGLPPGIDGGATPPPSSAPAPADAPKGADEKSADPPKDADAK